MKCEGCKRTATHRDSDEIPLCYECWLECCVDAMKAHVARQREALRQAQEVLVAITHLHCVGDGACRIGGSFDGAGCCLGSRRALATIRRALNPEGK